MNEDTDFSARPVQHGFTKNVTPRIVKIEEDHPWDGILIIMNGDKNHLFTKDYFGVLKEHIGNAYADNHAIIYLSDPIEGPISEDLDFMDERCFQRLPNFAGRVNLDFDSSPKVRMQEFKSMIVAIRTRQDLKFLGNEVKILGSCKIAGQQTLIPPTVIR